MTNTTDNNDNFNDELARERFELLLQLISNTLEDKFKPVLIASHIIGTMDPEYEVPVDFLKENRSECPMPLNLFMRLACNAIALVAAKKRMFNDRRLFMTLDETANKVTIRVIPKSDDVIPQDYREVSAGTPLVHAYMKITNSV